MKKDLVVIGGGFAGSYVAKNMQKKFNLTLIDDKDYFEFTPSVLRTIVEPKKIEDIRVNHKKYLKYGKFIMDAVTSIDKSFVYIKDGKVKYDYLAICSGSTYSLPMKAHNLVETGRSESLIKSYESLRNAKKILIIGGGLVGVELAAEIVTHYPEKEITMIYATDKLISRNKSKSINYAKKFFTEKGVKLVFNEKVLSFEKNTCKTDSGNSYTCDLGFICTGIVPNYSFMSKNFKSSLDERNVIIVNDYLQVKGCDNIFSAGDINNLKVEKTAQAAINQAKTICKNIIALSNGKELTHHTHNSRGMIISLGKYDGIMETKRMVLTGLIPAFAKYFLERLEMSRL